MNRFDQPHLQVHKKMAVALPLFLSIAIIVMVLRGISTVQDTTYEKQLESLETALTRSIAQCYAVEGVYPPNIEYLEKHYGLLYDNQLFLIAYDYYGGNLMPEVTVLRKTGVKP